MTAMISASAICSGDKVVVVSTSVAAGASLVVDAGAAVVEGAAVVDTAAGSPDDVHPTAQAAITNTKNTRPTAPGS